MHTLDLPAGASVQLIATARADAGLHRWDITMRTHDGDMRGAYGSRIGDRDIHQRVDIPPQDLACRLGVTSQHATADGWADDVLSVQDDTPNALRLAFSQAGRAGAQSDDVLLSFAFTGAGERTLVIPAASA